MLQPELNYTQINHEIFLIKDEWKKNRCIKPSAHKFMFGTNNMCYSFSTLMNFSISTPNLLNTIQSSSISTFFYFCKFQLDPRRGTNFKIEIKTEFPCKGDTEFSIRSTFSQTYKKNISSSCSRLLHTINGNVENS